MGNIGAIILAAGNGSRMKLKTTKQRLLIGNESVLRRTVKNFVACQQIASIVVVVREDEVDFAKSELADLQKIKKICVGGKTRLESASIGFSYLDSGVEYVAIHDAARCFVTPEIINAVIEDAKKYGAATASCNVTDTVKRVDSEGNITSTVDRNSLMLVQTPQVFRKKLYEKALACVELYDSSITDDNMLIERLGEKVHCTDTGKSNIKLTVKEDLYYANYLLNGDKADV